MHTSLFSHQADQAVIEKIAEYASQGLRYYRYVGRALRLLDYVFMTDVVRKNAP